MLTSKAAVMSSLKRSSFEAASGPASPLSRRAQCTWQASSCPAHGAWGFWVVSAALPLLTRGQSSGLHDGTSPASVSTSAVATSPCNTKPNSEQRWVSAFVYSVTSHTWSQWCGRFQGERRQAPTALRPANPRLSLCAGNSGDEDSSTCTQVRTFPRRTKYFPGNSSLRRGTEGGVTEGRNPQHEGL